MSIQCTRWAWTVEGISPTTKLVLLHLADRAREPLFNAWPTVKGIAADTGCSRATVTRALAQLRDRELILPIGYGGKTGQAVVYKLRGRWTKELGHLVWDIDAQRWARSDVPVGSQRDRGGLTVSLPIAHSEPHNQPDNRPMNDQQPTARRLQASGAPPEGQRSELAVFDFETLKKDIRNVGTYEKLESDQKPGPSSSD